MYARASSFLYTQPVQTFSKQGTKAKKHKYSLKLEIASYDVLMTRSPGISRKLIFLTDKKKMQFTQRA